MKGVQELRQRLAQHLESKGLEAVTAWGESKRLRPVGVVAAAREDGSFLDYEVRGENKA